MSSSTDDITTTTTIPSSSLIQSISSSSLVLLSYVDTHCHLDEIFIKLRVNTFDEYQSKYLTPPSTSSSSSYLQKPGGFLLLNQPQFEGCIAQFCDPAAYSPSFATYPQLLSYPHIYGCFGIHPYSSKYYDDVLESRLIQALEHPKCVGVGECGLDYHIHPSSHRNGSAASNTTQSSSDSMMLSSREKQLVAFRRQIELSFVYKKPIVMHIRNAEADLLMILEEYYNNEEHRGDKIHMHCYGGSIEHTEILLRLYPGNF
jgi:TatD DNase family protein